MADFGLMKCYDGENGNVLKTKCGTSGYMAPELLKEEEYAGPPVDIFACGVMLFMMYTGNQPFTKLCDAWHKLLINNPKDFMKRREIDDADFIDLVGRMMEIKPEKRITFEQIS